MLIIRPEQTFRAAASDPAPEASVPGAAPWVVSLDCPPAVESPLVGTKAARLAALRQAGLPVLDGFVVTTAATALLVNGGGRLPGPLEHELRMRWTALSGNGTAALVVRSSSTAEDGAEESMAGLYTSVLDVRGWDAFVDALAAVVASGSQTPDPSPRPMAVLVQPMLRPAMGGVLFGADPVTGRTDRRVVAAMAGGPDRLVAGAVDGAHYVLSRRGRVLSAHSPLPGLRGRHRRSLAHLASRLERWFARPQDVEWAIDVGGDLVVLQARPITALPRPRRPRARGPVFGPGPVAETFPGPLSPLEQALWVQPLRDGLREALLLTGAVGRRAARRSPAVVVVGGRVAADLDLLGTSPVRKPIRTALDLRRPGRRLVAAWRVGRLKAAFPRLAADVVSQVDARTLEVPELEEVSTESLMRLLARTGPLLRSVHAYEVLAGLLAGPHDPGGASGAAVGLWALVEGRDAGLTDGEIALANPAVLALVPPRVGPPAPLPVALPVARRPVADGDAISTWREILRLRARWLQELSARAAWVIAQRLVALGRLQDPSEIDALSLDQLSDVISGAADARCTPAETGPPLPVAFRLGPDGEVVALEPGTPSAARGAGGGRGSGPVHDGAGPPPPGSVLVVRTLDPGLAPMLPGLGGLVAETGSVLSHLAILAREFGVPTAVAVADAVRRFPAGSLVSVDGYSGSVSIIEEAPVRSAS